MQTSFAHAPQLVTMGNNYSAGAAAHAPTGNWSGYLAAHRKYIETGFQFPRLAVQEPQGIMILRVGETDT